MAINEKQCKHRIYLKDIRQWVEVSETVYREHTRFYDAFCKKAQYHGQCICPKNKFWLCDGDCCNCEYRRGGDMLSIDFTSENEDGVTCTPQDAIPDDSPLLDEIVCDKATLEQLFSRFQELMPEAEENRSPSSSGYVRRSNRRPSWYQTHNLPFTLSQG